MMSESGEIVHHHNEDDEIPEELRELIDDSGDKELIQKSLAYAEKFSGPLPHPRILKQYGMVMEDAPERIFLMAEKQQDHRIDLEKKVIGSDIKRADIGLVLGFILFFIFAVGSVILLAIGREIAGYSLLASGLLGGIGNFIRVGRERAKIVKQTPSQEASKPTTRAEKPPNTVLPAQVKKQKKRRRHKNKV
jgi:uncharacterized membrane protein